MPTPQIKVFDANGQYQASCHDYAAAAVLASFYGDGATVRLGHSKKDTVWIEGQTGEAANDYDAVGEAIIAENERRDAAVRAMFSETV